MKKVFNYSAGPAILPVEVLERAQAELRNYKGSGMSIIEVSHRSDIFQEVIDRAEKDLRTLMKIPDDYHVLFLQGGASTQFAMVPLNLLRNGRADFLDTGAWSQKAITELSRYGTARVVASSKEDNFTYIPEVSADMIDPQADYLHITHNNTIFGTRIDSLPQTGDLPVVSDVSSSILSEPLEVEKHGILYAGAQKNIGPSGVTVVVIKKDLVGRAMDICPKMLNYQTHVEKKSMFNTPPTFAIYMMGLVFEWTLLQGGVEAMESRNIAKSELLYNFLDQSSFYQANIEVPHRSRMNICFRSPSQELDKALIGFSEQRGCRFLQGHRSVGGLRASLYNAMPIGGVEHLISVLAEFEEKHHL